MATSMLVADVGDEMCWWQLWDVGGGFGHFYGKHPLSLHLSVKHQPLKDVTNIEIQLPTLSHQHHDFTNITITKINLSPNWVRIGFWIWSCTWILRFLLFSGHSEINEHILPLCDSFQTIWRVGWPNVLSKLDRAHFYRNRQNFLE